MTHNNFYGDFDYETFEKPRVSRGEDLRTPFQVDRDRVVFTYAFRSLQSKTQVFQSGEYDFYRTRLTHSLEVARVGRSICEHLRAQPRGPLPKNAWIDPDLVEAVCFAHDIGHPPFGHIGERKLNELMQPYGGFEGNAQTARIVSELIYDERREQPEGIQPSRAFLDGLLKYKELHSEAVSRDETTGKLKHPHNHFLYDEQAPLREWVFGDAVVLKDLKSGKALNDHKSIECQIMDWADDTAYCLHDIVDGVKAGFLTHDRIKQWMHGQTIGPREQQWLDELLNYIEKRKIERVFGGKIGHFIHAARLVEEKPALLADVTNRYRYRLAVAPDIVAESRLYKKVALDLIFNSPAIQQIEFKGGRLLDSLFNALCDAHLDRQEPQLQLLPDHVTRWIMEEFGNTRAQARRVCDFIASLTDGEAIRLYKRLFHADYGSILEVF